ncbi:MAG: hypothetical protein MZU97_26730 [Bacillus subtilis]|nr:hypothetical protein [Bacillus subtilis]
MKKSVLTEAALKKYADGRIFTGEQAKKLGFVDALGGTYEAHKALNSMIAENLLFIPMNCRLFSIILHQDSAIFFLEFQKAYSPIKNIVSSFMPFSINIQTSRCCCGSKLMNNFFDNVYEAFIFS